MQSRLSFAPPEYMEEYLDIKPGAVSVMGLMNDNENHVRFLIDEYGGASGGRIVVGLSKRGISKRVSSEIPLIFVISHKNHYISPKTVKP